MSHDEMIAVIAAHRDGKQIQARIIGGAIWGDCPIPQWSFGVYEYRVKPAPRVLYVNEYDRTGDAYGHTDKAAAEKNFGGGAGRCAVKYAEVMED